MVLFIQLTFCYFSGQIFAHFHKDGFRFLQTNKAGSLKNSSFILLMPSLSTVYRNNPNFRVVHLDPNLQAIKDYEQYFMNLVMVTGRSVGTFCEMLYKTAG